MRTSASTSVTGIFDSSIAAERALAELTQLGVDPEGLVVTRIELGAGGADFGPSPSISAAAWTGATVGALLGAVSGWVAGTAVTVVPGIGTLAAGGVISSLAAGAGLGAVIGGLLGTLLALRVPDAHKLYVETQQKQGRYMMTVYPGDLSDSAAEQILLRNGAYDTAAHLLPRAWEAPAVGAGHQRGEVKPMAEQERGLDPETVTGTEDAIDDETGALGTAGTPVTTGSGASGSTIGLGSKTEKRKNDDGDFAGATPDTASYDSGGKPDDPGQAPGPLGGVTGRPLGIGESNPQPDVRVVQDEVLPASAQDSTSQMPFAEQVQGAGGAGEIQASAGTNVPGTADPRGLGDNTDATERPPGRD